MARGAPVPGLEGHCAYGDFITGSFRAFDVDAPDVPLISLDLAAASVSDLARGRDGAIYAVTFGDPSIRELVAAPPAP